MNLRTMSVRNIVFSLPLQNTSRGADLRLCVTDKFNKIDVHTHTHTHIYIYRVSHYLPNPAVL